MAKRSSMALPTHRDWHEDLPTRKTPPTRVMKIDDADVNSVTTTSLEISRSSSLMRGLLTVLGIFGLVFYSLLLMRLTLTLFPLTAETRPLLWVLPLGIIIAVYTTYLALKVDLGLSKDRPIRFNRETGKVYVYEHKSSINPFSTWPVTVKKFDWETLHAEVHRQAGFNGKIYIQRFALWLVSCKPETNEVIDRFELKGNSMTTAELYDTWDYCRQYMEYGLDDLEACSPRPQDISFRRSFFEYFRFLDPSVEGRSLRRRMSISDWVVNTLIFLLGFWIFIPMGVGHYISMRLAPAVIWPSVIDGESSMP